MIFDFIPNVLASLASFLFPLFASYKALKTSDPAQLTPWLMYYVVLSTALLIESWLSFILYWVPFYAYARLFFLLYLVLPQTQGARLIYTTYIHPYVQENEQAIEDFIASSHEKAKAAGLEAIKNAVEWFRVSVLGMQPSPREPASQAAPSGPQSYTQSLLARFNVPAARWTGGSGNAGQDLFNLVAGAVSAAAASSGPGAGASAYNNIAPRSSMPGGIGNMSASGTLIPDHLATASPTEKMSFLASQKERLAYVLSALDRESQQLQQSEADRQAGRAPSISLDGLASAVQSATGGLSRPPSGQSIMSGLSGLSKSRSEVDFEKIEAESGEETEEGTPTPGARRRNPGSAGVTEGIVNAGWKFLGWGTTGGNAGGDAGRSTGFDR